MKKTILNFKTEKYKVVQLDALSLLKNLPDKSIDVIVTDPAYSGMNNHLKLGKGRIIGNYKDRGEKGKWFEEFIDSEENYSKFLEECFRVLKEKSHIYIMFDSYSLLTLGSLVRNYFPVKNIIVWDKAILGMGHYFRRQSEFILFASKGKKPISNRSTNDVWSIKRIIRSQYPTQKPVEVFYKMIFASKLKNQRKFIVCDPFLGSGSSAIAALKLKCNFIGGDISKKSISLSNKRIETFLKKGVDILEEKKIKK